VGADSHLQFIVGALRGLTSVSHDVTITSDEWELSRSDLLPALTDIGGSLTVRANNQITRFLRALRHVVQDVTFEVWGHFCALEATSGNVDVAVALQTVGGNLTVRGCYVNVCGANLFPALTSVGGALRLADATDDRGRMRMGVTGTPHLALGALDIQNTLLRDIPLHDDATVAPSGSIIISSNTNLCQCQADLFLQRVRALGFTGSANATGVACATSCTGRAACP